MLSKRSTRFRIIYQRRIIEKIEYDDIDQAMAHARERMHVVNFADNEQADAFIDTYMVSRFVQVGEEDDLSDAVDYSDEVDLSDAVDRLEDESDPERLADQKAQSQG